MSETAATWKCQGAPGGCGDGPHQPAALVSTDVAASHRLGGPVEIGVTDRDTAGPHRHRRRLPPHGGVVAQLLVRDGLYTGPVLVPEALGLCWSDVDLDARRLIVRRSLVDVVRGSAVINEVKQGRGRSMALDAGTVASLRSLRSEQLQERLLVGSGYTDHDLLFAMPDGAPYHPDRFARTFVQRVAKLGLPAIRVHDLRHTWATLALQFEVHPKVVQERLGHSSISVTLDIYSHVVPAMETDAAERVASMILGVGPTCDLCPMCDHGPAATPNHKRRLSPDLRRRVGASVSEGGLELAPPRARGPSLISDLPFRMPLAVSRVFPRMSPLQKPHQLPDLQPGQPCVVADH